MFQATPRVWFRPVSGSRHSEGFSKREALINPMFHSSNGNYGPSWFWQYHFVQGGRTFCRLLKRRKRCCSFLCSPASMICLPSRQFDWEVDLPESGRDLPSSQCVGNNSPFSGKWSRSTEICRDLPDCVELCLPLNICVWGNTGNMWAAQKLAAA